MTKSEKIKTWGCKTCEGLMTHRYISGDRHECGKSSKPGFYGGYHYISHMKECPKYKSKGIITLCGSTSFFNTFHKVNAKLTAQGYIVLSISVIIDKNKQDDETLKLKKMLTELHKEKIAMSDAIFIIDVGGYIGESTKKEIEFAKKHNKQIRYYSKENLLK